MKTSLKTLVILLVLGVLPHRADSFSKFVHMDRETDCSASNNFISPTNGDDEVFIKAWTVGERGWKHPLIQGCEISFMSYGTNGITYYFLGNATGNYINSESTRLQIYNDIVGDGEPVVEYGVGDSFVYKPQLLKKIGFTARLVNYHGATNFDFTLLVTSTDDIAADHERDKNDATIVLAVSSTVGGVVVIGIIFFVVLFLRHMRRRRQHATGGGMTFNPAAQTAAGFDNLMYASAVLAFHSHPQTAPSSSSKIPE